MKRPQGKEALERARSMRRFSTEAEDRLWTSLRDRRLNGAKFRRQTWLGDYVADFYCPAAKLVVKADGGQHAEDVDYDRQRTEWLEGQGIRVLRFWNNDVLDRHEGVLLTIAQSLTLPPPSGRRAPPSPLQGEG